VPPTATVDTAPAPADQDNGQAAPSYQDSSEIAKYQEEQAGPNAQQLRSLQEFVSEGEISSPIGIQLREARRKLNSGEEADGLLVVEVKDGSPAAGAGVHGYHRAVHNALSGAALVGAMFFPPAILLLPALDYAQIGESYDMIIGVDGSRVTNFLDFSDRMRDLRAGELVYLSVVRDGKRMQIAVPVPNDVDTANY
jgi:S1-C subfamily serine protease